MTIKGKTSQRNFIDILIELIYWLNDEICDLQRVRVYLIF